MSLSLVGSFLHKQLCVKLPVPTASFTDKTIIVTGSNVGLGLEASRWLVNLGAARVILACRNLEKGRLAAEDIRSTTGCKPEILEVWHLDMSSYASVHKFADKVNAELPRLDVLIANAGVAPTEFRITEDNEETITTNVVSLALLTLLLHPKLHQTAMKHATQTYITATGSDLYLWANFKERSAPTRDLFAALAEKTKKTDMLDRYNVSKVLLLLFMRQLASLAPLSSSNVIVNVTAPGFCESELTREYNPAVNYAMKILQRTTEVGSRTLVYGACAGPESHGQYVPECQIVPVGGLAKGVAGAELQARVWAELRAKLEAVRPGVTELGYL
ncbi:NAD(P)-binding protein [Lasiosphaeria hispida]|uniref:NAD(P)-binding protein n=1 Tax=Lasiosphaeria hispida TaxID=260671 RepID=A0AAJ0HLA5_9PEZI|nr:NAD(P)-binding protein [Lasiosphaeria hispida]